MKNKKQKSNEIQIKWKPSTRVTANPAAAFNFFEKVRAENNGQLNIDYAVEASRDPNSPLHNDLEWDDTKAGHEFRKNQIKYFVRNIEVVRQDVNTPVRAYESIKVEVLNGVTEKVEQKNIFFRTEDILANPSGRAQLLSQAIRDALAFRKRYAALSELAKLINVIDSEILEIEKRLENIV